MFDRVVVVGAGLAGLAAVAAALGRGASIRLLDPSVGASVLGGGAVDDQPWERLEDAACALGLELTVGACDAAVAQFVHALDLWELPAAGQPACRLATLAGRIRSARGRDRALLDLSLLPDEARVVVPRVPRSDWDADLLARALSAQDYARSRRMTFEPADAELLRFEEDQHVDAVQLALRHDEPGRTAWLGRALAKVVQRERSSVRAIDALLLGPWLGARASRASELTEIAGVTVGETVATLSSASGARFEAARDRLLGRWGVLCEPLRVTRVRHASGGVLVDVATRAEPIEADSVVLATGGLVSGGLRYSPPGLDATPDDPAPPRIAFALGFEAPVSLQATGEPLGVVSSLHGPALDECGWPSPQSAGLLELVGISCRSERAAERIFAAGDARADRPRTKLEAVRSGLAAGAAAAGEPGDDSLVRS